VTARPAADLVLGKMAAEDYRAVSVRLEREAIQREAERRPLTARRLRQQAFLARNAARAEELDPEPQE